MKREHVEIDREKERESGFVFGCHFCQRCATFWQLEDVSGRHPSSSSSRLYLLKPHAVIGSVLPVSIK